MNRSCFVFALLLMGMSFGNVKAQESKTEKAERMEWFKEARLGIFIHYGIYAVNGIDESWSFFNGYISHADYMKQLEGFTAANYDPKAWAKLIRESGAKYAVLTTKHHDGVALFDTRQGDMSVVNKTPAGRDLVKPFVKALRKENLKVGLYYSLLDWSHPDYPRKTSEEWRYKDDSLRWEKFVDFNLGQIEEVLRYRPDLWWFDGDWEQSAEKWHAREIREMILKETPAAILNSRLQGYGDYATPEQGLPLKAPENPYWELCMTTNENWGFQHTDTRFKTPHQVLQIYAEVLSKGGNLLLNIGPREDGTIPEEAVSILKELGRWNRKHEEAVYGTRAALPGGYFHGPSTLSKDSTKLYLFLPNKPQGQVMLRGVKNKINRIYVVGEGSKLSHETYLKPYWSNNAGVVFIDVPPAALDEQMTVLCLMLDGKLRLD